MIDAPHAWVLEAFDDGTDDVRARWQLPGFTDDDASVMLQLTEIGFADLYDIGPEAVEELAGRFGLDVLPEGTHFTLGREQT